MRYIRLLIEYDGAGYHGWQAQKSEKTIQGVVHDCLAEITDGPVVLTGASRTDAGVHALGQVAVVQTGSRLAPEIIMRALNAKLPDDIRILASEETDSSFHPRFGASHKSYFYLISTGTRQSAFLRNYCWQVWKKLDIDEMRRAAVHLIGEHDFSAFRGADCGAKTTVRTIMSLHVSDHEHIDFMTASINGSFIKIWIEADAFLRHMVRNIAGTLVDVGKGKIKADDLPMILRSCDRTKAGPTAPGKGLFLERIIY